MQTSEHSYITQAVDWFLSYIEPTQWEKRRKVIIQELQIKKYNTIIDPASSLSTFKDLPASYIFYAECYTKKDLLQYYDFQQGARIIPIFISIGKDLYYISYIKNIDHVVNKFFNPKNDNPDSELFEISISLLYARNGYTSIEFIPEAREKRPDIKARKNGSDIFIECKKMSKASQFAQEEADVWRKMWKEFNRYVIALRRNIFFEIIFRNSLSELDINFFVQVIQPKLKFIPPTRSSVIFDNEDIKITVKDINLNKIKDYLSHHYLKFSSQFIELATGDYHPHNHYSFLGSFKESTTMPTYMSDISYLIGATWICTDEDVVNRKARDVYSILSKAHKQLPEDAASRVHIGLETIEGVHVTTKRFKKIINTVKNFDAKGKNLKHVICHFLESIVPPDGNWRHDQTILWFNRNDETNPPLHDFKLYNLPIDEDRLGVHWEQL